MKIVRFLLVATVAMASVTAALVDAPRAKGAHLCPAVLTTIPVGFAAREVAVDATRDRIYVGGDGLAVIDGSTNSVIATAPTIVGTPVAVNPATNRLYVMRFIDSSVSVVDGETLTLVNTIIPPGGGHELRGLAVNPATNRVYVSDSGANKVWVIDGATNVVVAGIAVGPIPTDIAVNPVTNRVYVARGGFGPVFFGLLAIDGATNSVIGELSGTQGNLVSVNPATDRIYAMNSDGRMLDVIDGASGAVVTTLFVGEGVTSLAVNPAANRIYVGTFSSLVFAFDGETNARIASAELTNPVATGIAVNSSTDRVYVTSHGSDTVVVLADLTDPIAPTVGMPSFSVNPKSVSESSLLSAIPTDDSSGTGIRGGEYFIGADPGQGNGTPMLLTGSTLTATIGTSLPRDVYTVGVRAQDRGCNWSPVSNAFLVVYDPNDGFANGAGSIVPGSSTSDAGDLLPGLDNTSKAQFAFVVKYTNGASTVPGGSLEFHYRAGDFQLRSAGMDWLVVTNQNWAKFQGQATIQGASGTYPFRVDARDGDLTGQADRFVIRIYAPAADPNTSEPIYKASGDVLQGHVQIHR
jgi:YVTN family beta-propeller protein